MNKAELVDAIAAATGQTKAEVARALDATTLIIQKALEEDDEVTLVGFGTFKVSKRAARAGRNPQTGEKIQIKATKAPVFKAGKALKDAVNRGGKKEKEGK